MKKILNIILVLLLFQFGLSAQLVLSSADNGLVGTLRYEILNAAPGATITFAPTLSLITLGSEIPINKDVTIDGGVFKISLNGNLSTRIFNITGGDVTLTNLNFRNGVASDGGAIYATNSNITLVDCLFDNNVANATNGSGGAIFMDVGADVEATNCTFSNNRANRAGGAIEDDTGAGLALRLTNVQLLNNNAGVSPATAAPGNGGGLHITGAGSSLITGGTVSGNVAASEGGGLWNGSGIMTVDGTTITGNTASGDAANNGGGGIFNIGGILNVDNATINNNIANGSSGSGGGILNDMGTLNVTNTTFTDNSANRAGGGIEDNSMAGGMLTVVNVNFTNNSVGAAPGNGGGLHITGPGNSMITNGDVIGNTAASEGGGLWNGSGTMTVDGTVIKQNTASGAGADNGGGGLFNAGGTLIVMNATIDDNIADGASGSGGGILNDKGVLTVSATTLTGNSSNRAGGGIEDNSIAGNTLTLTDVDFTDNSTGATPGNGGGLHITGPGNSMITNGDVIGNTAASEGGGLWNGSGTMTVDGTVVKQNTASGAGADNGGGGLFNAGGTLIVMNATIDDNVADGASGSGGGILNDKGVLTVSATTLTGNSSSRAGGGIEDNSIAGNTLTLTDVDFTNNSTGAAPGNGGGLHITGPGNSMITNGDVIGNTAASEGGGLWNGSGIMTVDGTVIKENIASGAAADNGGGGIFNNGGTLNAMNVTLESNEADGASGSGGGLFSTEGAIALDNITFTSNAANRAGGAIELIDGSLSVSNSVFDKNNVNGLSGTPAPGNGGAFHITGIGQSTFNLCTFNENEAGREGGGVWNQAGSTMDIVDCTFSGNMAVGNASDDGGGAFFSNGGTSSIESSVFYDNFATGTNASGGAVHGHTGSNTTIKTSTFSGNTATDSGGGIFQNGQELSVDASTITNNTSAMGGGLTGTSLITIKNSIVALNLGTSGVNLSGQIQSDGYNLVDNDDLGVFTSTIGDLLNQNPLLGPLQNNGGSTLTHELLSNSPAYNAGDPADQFNDQIGQAVFMGTRDIGAFESQINLTSVKNLYAAEDQLSVFPNPALDHVTIKLPRNLDQTKSVDLINVATGQKVQMALINNNDNRIELNGISPGVYVIRIVDGKEAYRTEKFVIID